MWQNFTLFSTWLSKVINFLEPSHRVSSYLPRTPPRYDTLMADNGRIILSITVDSIQFSSPTDTDNLPVLSTFSMAASSSTMQTSFSSVPTTLVPSGGGTFASFSRFIHYLIHHSFLQSFIIIIIFAIFFRRECQPYNQQYKHRRCESKRWHGSCQCGHHHHTQQRLWHHRPGPPNAPPAQLVSKAPTLATLANCHAIMARRTCPKPKSIHR